MVPALDERLPVLDAAVEAAAEDELDAGALVAAEDAAVVVVAEVDAVEALLVTLAELLGCKDEVEELTAVEETVVPLVDVGPVLLLLGFASSVASAGGR